MEITTTQAIILGILITTGIIAGVSYNIYSTGEELTCRTNKPYGWMIQEEYQIGNITVYNAYCPYVTQDWVYANCSGFRSTSSYERYGCDEVKIIHVEVPVEQEIVHIQHADREELRTPTDCIDITGNACIG